MPAQAATADQTQNLFLAPTLALTMWNPFLAGAGSNGQAQDGFAILLAEWQNFLARRFREDLVLAQRLAGYTTPDQIWIAYAEFWQKAAEDYGSEYAKISKLMAGVTNKTSTATQSASNAFPSMKAA